MSGNEISNAQRKLLQQKQQQVEAATVEREQPEIEVFASKEAAPIINMGTEDTNSVFIKDSYLDVDANELRLSGSGSLAIDVNPTLAAKFPGWTQKDLAMLAKLEPQKVDVAASFTKTHLEPANIVAIAKMFPAGIAAKILTKVNAVEAQASKTADGKETQVYRTVFDWNSYNKNQYDVRSINFNSEMYSQVLENDLSIRSVEVLKELKTADGKKYREVSTSDKKTGITSKTRFDFNEKYNTYLASYETRVKKDAKGNLVFREYSKPSAIPGIFNTTLETPKGTQKVSNVVVDPKTGKKTVTKDVKSIDGTRTQYTYTEEKNGNHSMTYKITDKDGKVLMNNTKTYKKVSDTQFKSTFNKDSYTMTVKDNKLTIKQDNKPTNTATIDLGAIKGDSEALAKVLKTLTGDELIKLSKTVNSMEGISNVLESYYQPGDKSLHSGADAFVVLHEAGHAKDFQKLNPLTNETVQMTMSQLISRQPELKAVYDAERKAFVDAFPNAQRENVDYFINILTHYSGKDGGLQETIAEGNAIASTPKSHELLALRTQYLQQYFPKTMAMLNKYYNQ